MSQENEKESTNYFQIYWRLYGGWPALLSSKYLWFSVIFSVVCSPLWTSEEDGERPWASAAVEIIPSLMAFSLGAMAILLAFSNERFMEKVQEKGKAKSLYMLATASFFHFILLQTISLFCVILLQAYTVHFISAIGFFFMIYGMCVAVSTAGILLRMAQIFNLLAAIPKK
ncbi:hypothetical protein [Cognatishimia sp.]|uniref:hypothetical protein n=1 Tax=Cognatishimia sp. TaxID=2211648 RepID=UPI003512439F